MTSPEPASDDEKNTTAVGAIVVSPEGVLLVRMCYGPTKGRFMIPGGIVDPGETLDAAIEREVLEETGVVARVEGICGLRSRCDGRQNDTYVLFLMTALSGEPRPDGHENDEARYFSAAELEGDEVTDLSAYFGGMALAGTLTVMPLAADFDAAGRGRDPVTWRLFR